MKMKQIFILMGLSMVPGLNAMRKEDLGPKRQPEQPELRRVVARPLDIALLNLLKNKDYEAASGMINYGVVHRSAAAVAELRKPEVAEEIFNAALKENHSNTINVLINLGLLSRERTQKEFDKLVATLIKNRYLDTRPGAKTDTEKCNKMLLSLLDSRAAKLLDLNRFVSSELGTSFYTALHVASDRLLVPLARALLAAGADPNIQYKFGFTPLMTLFILRVRGNYHLEDLMAILHLLLAHPLINLEIKEHYGMRTALIQASLGDYEPAVLALIQKGANINAVDKDGRTALMNSIIQRGADRNVPALLKYGTNVTIRDKYGRTALDLAREREYPEIQALVPLIEEKMKQQMEKK